MHSLRPYQNKLIDDAAYKASLGHKRIILQAPTGAGKSVIFATLIKRYADRNPDKKVVIACHREKLVKQSRKTLYDWYGIIAETVFATTRHLLPSAVYSGMAETLHRRFTKNPNYIRNIGLLVIDEAHLGLFTKFIELHPEILVIGFTATPIASNKKEPLNGIYSEIVCGPQINDLIGQGSLTPNITHRVKNSIDRKQIKTKLGEYDQNQAGRIMSSVKHVNNTVEAYEKFAKGLKTIIFNCNIEHSKTVTAAFNAAGYACRHIDGYHPSDEDLKWFEDTPDAILCNVGIATTGFDITDIGACVVNKLTKSLPLFIQMCGRGSRLHPGKKYFKIIDMGKNYMEHGDWSDDRDWTDWFHNPNLPKEGGVAPVKYCPHCEALIHASARVCPFCGADVSNAPVYDDESVEFETLIQGKPLVIPVTEFISETEQAGRKEYATLHQIKSRIVAQAKNDWRVRELTDAKAYRLLELYQDKVREWCKAKKKNYNQWHKDITTQWFFSELKRVFNWEPERLEIAI